MKKLYLLILGCLCSSFVSSASVVYFFNDTSNATAAVSVSGAGVTGGLTNGITYEGANSAFISTAPGTYSTLMIDPVGNIDIGTNHYLQARFNFDTSDGGGTKLVRVRVNAGGVNYDYYTTTHSAYFTVDGSEPVFSAGRVVFDSDINTWQTLNLDLTALSPASSQINYVNFIFYETVNEKVYVDDVQFVSQAIPEPGTLSLFLVSSAGLIFRRVHRR